MRFLYHPRRYRDTEVWFWKLVAKNGRIMADGGGFNTKRNCIDSIKKVRGANSWDIIERTAP